MKWFKRLFPFIFLTALVVGAVFLFGNFLRIDRSHLNPVPSIEEIRLEDFSYSPEDGYTFLPAPFGTPEDEMVSLFGYSISQNTTSFGAPTFDLLGLPAKYDSELSPGSILHSLTFSLSSNSCSVEEIEAAYAEILAHFEAAFVTADETERKENALGPLKMHTWRAEDHSNYLRLEYSAPSPQSKNASLEIFLWEPINYSENK